MVKDFFECQSTDPDTMLHVEIFTPSDMEIKGVIQIVHGMTNLSFSYSERDFSSEVTSNYQAYL